ncbi:class I adenylate-forming enzyme family protein [Leptospira perolatii]|nr:AMP-binding protein [Leptospira perolatii]
MKSKHIPELLKDQAAKYGKKVFVIFLEKEVTYQEQYLYSVQTANLLGAKAGFSPKDRLGILLPNGLDFLNVYFGAMFAGGTALPFNILLKGDELLYQINHSEINTLVTNTRFFQLIQPVLSKMENLKTIIFVDDENVDSIGEIDGIKQIQFQSEMKNSSSELPTSYSNIQESDIAGMLYTSGTTGKPKGCMLTHKNYLSNVDQFFPRMMPEDTDTYLCIMPLFHVNAQLASVMLTLSAGARLILEEQFKPRTFIPTLQKYTCRCFSAVPAMYNFLNEMPEYKDGADLSFVKACICGAAPMPVEVFNKFEKKFNAKILEGYGLSEGTCVSTLNPLDGKRKIGSIGLPLDMQEVKIMDHQGKFLSTGQIGEIVVKGGNVMAGYYKDEKSTKETIVDGWLHTGDLGHIDEDGYFFITGRKKEMLIRGGENIYPKEIEEVLYQMTEVADCAVIGFPDEKYGEQVVAVIKRKPEVQLDEKSIKLFLREKVANYKMPGKVIFIEEFPRTASGKIQKLKLRDELLSGQTV